MLGHLVWGDQVFLDVIEPAAMDLPILTIGRARDVAIEPKVQGDEIKGRSDPRDRCDRMGPAHREFEPGPKHSQIIHNGPPSSARVGTHRGSLSNSRSIRYSRILPSCVKNSRRMSYLDNIRAFVRVYALGTMSAAGRDLRIYPAVTSAWISQVESPLRTQMSIPLAPTVRATVCAPNPHASGAQRPSRSSGAACSIVRPRYRFHPTDEPRCARLWR